ncbi:CpxP family protein [Photobacterium aphoticum]|uniref:Periplasmic repressor CpxP n=1 Tax=Photobacterium aphoticum TaxID=754436 RepID=A0A0J1GJH9_9GAMM|nr:CpxP family protein [Photobacterium aphoticum]KLU99658.1 periplasmic repressor CpxP [Photobacterium aphoticum]GHA44024.1 periplasmic repressor CpxP [Photobacterium aphoticum]
MTSLKKTLALVIALPLALGSASALAYGGGKHHKDGGKHGCGMDDRGMFRALDLTDAQKDEMKTLRKANREAMHSEFAAHRSEMQAQHQKMQQLVLADNFDEAAVRALAETMSEQQIDRRVAMMKQRHAMMQILTPEQKTKYQELKAERMEKCQAKMAEKHGN